MTGQVNWSARWYLWDGGFLAIGRSTGVVPPHAHHAVQIAFGVGGEVAVRDSAGRWQNCAGVIIRPNVEHSFDGNGVVGALLFVEPDSREGHWLQASLVSDITIVPAARLEACLGEIRAMAESPLEAMDPGELVRHCVRALCAGAPPLRRLDARVARVLAAIRSADDLRITLEEAAAMAFLSPGRFAHLFTEHVGLPFRRYVLWRKLTRGMVGVGRGLNLAEAAHAAGFADGAHMTRTCTQMFGIPPSVMMRGEFFEIPSPFDLQPA